MLKFLKNLTKSHKIAFWICLGISTALLVSSFIIPPKGVIDPSVLRGVGEIFAFCCLYTVIEALQRGTDVTLQKGDVNLHLNNPDSKDEDEDK